MLPGLVSRVDVQSNAHDWPVRGVVRENPGFNCGGQATKYADGYIMPGASFGGNPRREHVRWTSSSRTPLQVATEPKARQRCRYPKQLSCTGMKVTLRIGRGFCRIE